MQRAWRPAVAIIIVLGIWDLGFKISYAAVPPVMNYQGKLTDAAGKLVPDGSYEMRFSLYDDGYWLGTALWTETWESPSAVPVTNGQFGVMLGSRTPFSLPFDEGYWLGVEVKKSGAWETLSPRQQIASAAYALRAKEADTVGDGAITLSKLDTSTIPGLDGGGNSVPRVPVILGMHPGAKAAGYSSFIATIEGENFQKFSDAKIGSMNLTEGTVIDSGSMTATVPEGLPGGVYDVLVSNLDFMWGEGAGLFAVLTHTPTVTPTATSTPTPTVTPTVTPTPLTQSVCESAPLQGFWAPRNDPGGNNGCWFIASETGHSCNDVCGGVGLECADGYWHDGNCSACRHYKGSGKTCSQSCWNDPTYSVCCDACADVCSSGPITSGTGGDPTEIAMGHAYCNKSHGNQVRMCVCE